MDKEQLIKKWLNNDLTDAESKAFRALDEADLYIEIVEEAQRFSGSINAKVESFDILDEQLLSKDKSSTNWIRIVSSLAAILVVGFALFTVLNRDKVNTFETDIAQNETINLPDNSIVKLNELSELKYNASDWDDNRSLILKGEAYFDVEKGQRFDVNTDYGTVTVLGTEFNVLSREGIFKVACYEGLVQIIYSDDKVNLPAGTEFVLSSEATSKSNIAISEPYWLKNMSVFEDAPIIDVIKELIKQYNVRVSYPSDMPINFTGAFEHNNLENALKSITQPLNLTYTIKNNNEVIIGNVQN